MSGIKLIGCRGGDPDAPRLLAGEGWEYGIRSDYKAYSWPYFIDIDWKKYIWSDHISVIRKLKPAQAMTADYLHPSQKKGLLQQVNDLRGAHTIPMVCPKFNGAVADIPTDCLVAISIPTNYAGFLPEPRELTGRKIHFLGGHPDQFLVLIERYQDATVISIDCSAIFQKAQYGAYWSYKKATWRYVKNRFATHALIRMSARNVMRYLDNGKLIRERKRLESIGFRIQPFLPGLISSAK